MSFNFKAAVTQSFQQLSKINIIPFSQMGKLRLGKVNNLLKPSESLKGDPCVQLKKLLFALNQGVYPRSLGPGHSMTLGGLTDHTS